jgi:hypothetical protein
MILSDSHKCKNSPGEVFQKKSVSHFSVLEGVAGNTFFIVPSCLYLDSFATGRYTFRENIGKVTG